MKALIVVALALWALAVPSGQTTPKGPPVGAGGFHPNAAAAFTGAILPSSILIKIHSPSDTMMDTPGLDLPTLHAPSPHLHASGTCETSALSVTIASPKSRSKRVGV